jgi:hypothetical protein
MALPNVNETVLDGQLASANFIAGQTPMIVGCSSIGTAATVKGYAGNQAAQIVTDWGYGPMPQQAARLSAKGIAVTVCRTAGTTAGACSAVSAFATGTSVVTTSVATAFDTSRMKMLVVAGGTIGVAGIAVQFSFDGGETYGAIVRLGTATTYAIPNTGVTLAFAAGTFVTGESVTFTTTEPKWNGSDLSAALTAVADTGLPWDFLHVVGSMNATEAATLKTWLTGLETAKKPTRAIVETVRIAASAAWSAAADATWQAVLIADWATFTSKRMCAGAGDLRWVSAIDNSVYLRPLAWLGCEMASLFDPARYELGRVKDDGHNTGALDASLYDTNGNVIAHNELNYPGLYEPAIAAIGFMVTRTYPEKGRAAYIAKAKLLSPAGSDFQSFRLGRVMDIAELAMNAFFINEIQETPPVNANGTILTTYAEALELQAQQILAQQLVNPGRANATTVSIHRNENLLSGPFKGIVNVDIRVQPTPTTDFVNITLSFTPTLPSA